MALLARLYVATSSKAPPHEYTANSMVAPQASRVGRASSGDHIYYYGATPSEDQSGAGAEQAGASSDLEPSLVTTPLSPVAARLAAAEAGKSGIAGASFNYVNTIVSAWSPKHFD